jgi:hypothetical protein
MHIAKPYLWSTVELIAKTDHGLNLLNLLSSGWPSRCRSS